MKRSLFLLTLAAALPATSVSQAAEPVLKLSQGDHVAIIGNALADRMQHHGWLEALIHKRFPEHQLTFRNLGFAGDEVVTRFRSDNFGTPDEWLDKEAADVILAFFGFNESFKGPDGLAKFENDLDAFLKDSLEKEYNGETPPQLILFSPLAFEDLGDTKLPDAEGENARIEPYVTAMGRIAEANEVPFVNLFELSQNAQGVSAEPLTFNGVHLTEQGDKQLAPLAFESLFGEEAPSTDDPLVAKLREAVVDKNWQFFQRYRTVDGYNVYGGRSQLKFGDLTNFHVMQEEMSVRDVMTQNRDERVWAIAQGDELEVNDDNLPTVTPVPTNLPGPKPDESHEFLSGEEAISRMKLAEGCEVNLFASEEEFPELVNPVQMAWDTQGRLWVAAWKNYPERTPTSEEGDTLLVFEDTDGDGKADKMTPFLDDLNCPTGFQFYKDGVLVMQAPDLWFVRDTDGDGRGDWKENVLNGVDSADSHHTTNAMVLDPAGAVYLSDGVFHRTQVESIYGPIRNVDGAIYRYEPQSHRFERYIPYGFANPHGRVFDEWGNDIITDATGNANYFGPAFSGHIDFPDKHPGMQQFWNRPSRPCAATGMLYSRHFPQEFQGNFLNLNVIGFLGIFQAKVTEEGSGLKGETIEHLIESDDKNFRPSAVSIGPDGAVYFCDWHNPIIGHMQHHLRDPNRDQQHGRIYRITYKGRDLIEPPKIAGEPIENLLELLKVPELGTRDLAKIELSQRDPAEVSKAVDVWKENFVATNPEDQHHLMEALWMKQYLYELDLPLLKQMLRSPDHRARAAATRVLCYQRDMIGDEVFSLLRPQAEDEHPRVRLEAVRTASFFQNVEAAEIALSVLQQPTDYYLDYCLGETIRQLEPYWRKAIAEGTPIAANNPEGINYLLKSVNTDELLKLPQTPEVLGAMLSRSGVPEVNRVDALIALNEQNGSTSTEEILSALPDAADESVITDLTVLLRRQSAEELAGSRNDLARLMENPSGPGVAESAAASIMIADGAIKPLWEANADSVSGLTTVLRAIPLVPDPAIRASVHQELHSLAAEVPANLVESAGKGTVGRFVRIQLPRRGTLTLAEVEVISDGRNVAPNGKATQSSTSNGGEASRAIDGNKSGSFSDGGQTHTNENERSPWWELDLGSEMPIESVAIWNRTEQRLGRRLNRFELTVLDNSRRETYSRGDNSAPDESVEITLSGDPLGSLRRAAIQALVSTGIEPEGSFTLLCDLIQKGEERATAASAIRQLPRSAWNGDAAGATALTLLEWAETVPAGERTDQDYIEIVQVAQEMAGLLKPERASEVRKAFRELGVSVFIVKTIRERLMFDTPRIVVEAGKPFELIFENNDQIPHNLLIITPKSRGEVGTAAQTMPMTDLDDQGRAYVPDSEKVLAATKLLEAGQSETLQMNAPSESGEYEFVCTFPGHWMIMWGYLIVTEDVDAYLQENPKAPEILPSTN